MTFEQVISLKVFATWLTLAIHVTGESWVLALKVLV